MYLSCTLLVLSCCHFLLTVSVFVSIEIFMQKTETELNQYEALKWSRTRFKLPVQLSHCSKLLIEIINFLKKKHYMKFNLSDKSILKILKMK